MLSGFRKLGTLSLLLLLVATPSLMFAQGIVTGSIAGTVTDPQQAVISGAKVTAKNDATNAEVVTNSNAEGLFRITNLPVGTYTVTIEAPKFNTRKLTGVAVNSGRETGLGTQSLAVGGEGTTVEVTEAAPLVEGSTAMISSTFTAAKVEGLPNNGGGFDNLALYVPGMSQVAQGGFSNTNGASVSANGQRGRSNNFQIDGQSNNDNSVAGPSIFLNNPDILAEFTVSNSNFSAEYGRNTGSVINYVTKSGTNAFHGTAFEYYFGNWGFSRRNSEKNPVLGWCPAGVADGSATTYTGSCSASTVPRYVENRYGGTIGGPIWRDKAWFFFGFQGDRIRQGGSPSDSSTELPTPAGLTALAAAFPGNAAVAALQATGPYSVAAGNPISIGTPTNRNVTVGATTVSIPFSRFRRNATSLYNEEEYVGRGDWQISSKDRLFGRYVYETSINTVAAGTVSTGGYVDVPAISRQIALDWTRSWTSRLVTQARFSFSRAKFGFEGGGFSGCTQANINNCPTSVGFTDGITSGFGLASNLPQGRLVQNTQYQSNNVYQFGKHTLKWGGDYSRQNSPAVFLPNINGTFTFSSFNNYMAGTSASFSLADGPPSFRYKEQDLAFYFQDDWRVKDNLTVQIGLRWEWTQQAINLLSKITRLNQARPIPLWSLAAPVSVTTLPNIPEDLNNFGPVLGFAWTPKIWKGILGENKTVIRGGYRMAYDPAFYNIFLNVQTAAPVVNLGTVIGPGVVATNTGADTRAAYLALIPTGANPGFRTQTRVSSDFHNPYTMQWSLGMQREIHKNFAAEVRYVGSHTVGNFMTVNANPIITSIPAGLIPAGITACTTAGTPGVGRPDCNFSNVRLRNNGAFAIFHSLQSELRIQNFHGLNAGVTYTFAKNIDNTSEVFQRAGTNSAVVSQNPFDPSRAERGISALSFPHVYTTYWVYDLPWYSKQNGVLGKVLGGWQWGTTYRFQSGQPFNPTQTVTNPACDTGWNNAFIGVDSCRVLLGNPAAPIDTAGRYVGVGQFVNNSACTGAFGSATCPFVAPTTVHWIINNTFTNALSGNPFLGVPRNQLRGQTVNRFDMSIQKSTKLVERVNLLLRIDAFNVFNRQFFGLPGISANSRNLNSVIVGTSTAIPGSFMNGAFNTGTNRSLQISAKIQF